MNNPIIKWLRKSKTTNPERLFQKLSSGCVECGNPASYYEGPRGGASVNIFCSYCGQGYNVTPAVAWAERISKNVSYIDAAKVQPPRKGK